MVNRCAEKLCVYSDAISIRKKTTSQRQQFLKWIKFYVICQGQSKISVLNLCPNYLLSFPCLHLPHNKPSCLKKKKCPFELVQDFWGIIVIYDGINDSQKLFKILGYDFLLRILTRR